MLETFLPGANEHFETGTSVVLDRAPHIEDAYILPEPHHAELMPAVRAPEGRIHFAGEHTSFEPNGGAMTFAFESAARALLELGLVRGSRTRFPTVLSVTCSACPRRSGR